MYRLDLESASAAKFPTTAIPHVRMRLQVRLKIVRGAFLIACGGISALLQVSDTRSS